MASPNKPPLIFIHGLRGSPLGLAGIAKHFSKDYQVFSPSIPPFGGAKPLKKYTVESYTNFIKDFIKEHQLKHPILIGHSMGSIIAAATAHRFPKLINQKLVLMAPISVKPAKFFARLEPLGCILPRKLADHISTAYLFIPKASPKLYRKIINITHQCSDYPIKKSDLRKAIRFSTQNSISDFKLSQDTLFLAGEKDRMMKKSKTETLAKSLPHAKTVFIPNTGHLLNYENPKAVVRAIRDFLAE